MVGTEPRVVTGLLAGLLLAVGIVLLLATWLFLLPDLDGDGGANEMPQAWRIVELGLSLAVAGAGSASLILFRSGSRVWTALMLLFGGVVAAAAWLVIYAATIDRALG
jgi:hypothetical protein